MTGIGHDFRFALRQLLRNPGFAAAAAVTLALGIAATTTVFSFVDAVLLRPLPYAEPSRLYVLWNARPGIDRETLSYLNFVDYRARASAFEQLALFRRRRFNVSSSEGPERLRGAFVTAEFFRTLRVTPAPGRDFVQNEDQAVLVSEGYWRRRLGGDPAAIGKAIRVDGTALTVIGVVPGGLAFPSDIELWVPLSREEPWLVENRGLQGYTMVGRLGPGATAALAQDQVAAVAAGLAAEYPDHNAGWTVRLEPLQDALSGDVRPTLLLLFGSAGILLLVSAVNLASMLLARATARQREIAVRRAVGAGDRRLVRQFVTESLVLAGFGGALGVLGAVWAVQVWREVWENPAGMPSVVTVNWRALVFALVLSAGTALLFGLAPGWRMTRTGLGEMLRSGGRTTFGLGRSARVLVAGELALALVLGIGGSLLVRSLLRLQAVDPGFDPSGVLVTQVSLPNSSYPEPKQIIGFYRRLLEEVTQLPGVVAAGAGETVPLMPGGGSFGFAIEGQPTVPAQARPVVSLNAVTPAYFRALGIELTAGRSLLDRDDHTVPDVAVINRTMARRYWPDRNPIGERITFESDGDHWIEIVGVVGDVRERDLARPAAPQVYIAHAQWGYPGLSVVVRTRGDPMDIVPMVREVLVRLDPELPVTAPRTMEQALDASLVPERLRTTIFSAFAGLALVLAGIGIYGVMAYLVTQRQREIAVRMALGAGRADVVSGVIAQSLRLALPGVGLGIAGALVSARVMRGFLYEVAPTDPLILAVVSASVAALVAAAALIPARRAAQTDPMTVLRSE